MTRFNSKLVGRRTTFATLTFTAATILTATTITAQHSMKSPHQGPTSTGEVTGVDVGIKNKLRFPYGVQKFERMKPTQSVTDIPGWEIVGTTGALEAYITTDPSGFPRGGSLSRRWVCVDDYGASAGDGFRTPVVVSPDPWDYAWTWDMRIDAAPTSATNEWPVFAIQHDSSAGFQDAWGIQLTDTGANLFVTSIWGTAASAPLFSYVAPTSVGQWINIRVVASIEHNELEAFVNDVSVATLRMRPQSTTNVERQRLSYHGVGAGAQFASVILDDVGVAFLSGVCKEPLNVDFTTEDDSETLLVNGQDVSTAPEFGYHMAIASGGPNNGAAIFDSDSPGPNSPSQDLDLLVNQGNILILQNDDAPVSGVQSVSGVFDRPNDDDDGGTFSFVFNRFLQPISIDLIDIDSASNEGVVVTLTDYLGRTRTYTVPADWTGDITLGDPGVGTLDLTALANQPGFNSVATAVEDPGYFGDGVASMVIVSGGSCGLDNFIAEIPCVEITNENEDDGDPDTAGTALADGQDISTPPEYGVEVAIASAGANLGAANFDSTPGGPNDGVGPGFPDKDLLVGLGNIMILQNTNNPAQAPVGFFTTPDDDQDGGTVTFTFPCLAECHYIDVIDIDQEDNAGMTLTLLDSGGDTRVYTIPIGFTEKLTNDGPPAFRRIDLETLLPQPGFIGAATAAEFGVFDDDEVVSMTVSFGDAHAIDNFCFCPRACP
jgi:hypothetical protein